MNRVFYMFFLLGCSTDTFTGVDGDADPPGDSAVDPETSADGGMPDGSPDASGEASSPDVDAAPLDAPIDVTSPTSRRVFVTSKTVTPNFGSLSAADAICQSAASSLGGTWMAWLSTSSTSAASRLEHSADPYKLLDGTVVASDWAGLTSGTLMHAINLDEHKTLAPSATTVLTGTFLSGNSASDNCSNWTTVSSSYEVAAGEADALVTDSSWTYALKGGCNATYYKLYCVEQL